MDKTAGKNKGRIPWGTGRIYFLAHKDTIEALMLQGWPLKHIYSHLATQLNGLSYPMFTLHVKRFLGSSKFTTPTLQTPSTEIQTTTKPAPIAKFYRPGPRIPDPKDLY